MDTREYKQSHKPAIDLLIEMGYKYVSREEAEKSRISLKHVLLSDILKEKLMEINSYSYNNETYKFSEYNIKKALGDLDIPISKGLLNANEAIYNKLILGGSYKEILPDGRNQTFDIKYIDWDNFDRNDFYITEEFYVEGQEFNARPDIVLFINGIPIAVIEAKRPSVHVTEAINQMVFNQEEEYIPNLFKFIQIVAAINMNEFKYATCLTQKKFWSYWREEDTKWLEEQKYKYNSVRTNAVQDGKIISVFSTNRIKELIYDFTIFTNNRIIARHQQYFAVKKIIETMNTIENGKRRSGVIWHTQGSGKSLTMVMVVKYLLENAFIPKARVIIVTDRVNLDKQIKKTLKNSNLEVSRAEDSEDLIKFIKNKETLITTIVNKFKIVQEKEIKIEDRDTFILVDEAHRTQSGILNESMTEVFPNACYIAFTGTPLMKKEKNTMKRFGFDPEPLHVYRIEDGVRDNAIVELYYESRFVEQNINTKEINRRFNELIVGLTEKQVQKLNERWTKLESVTSSKTRIQFIAQDIYEHYDEELKNTEFNAILATNRVREALIYQKELRKIGDIKVKVVVSKIDIKALEHNNIKVKFHESIIKEYRSYENYEETVKELFIEGHIDILIVVDKLLTGFDAPRAKVLYIDKSLKEHSLLQAIARVNRIFSGKDKGKIIDYYGLLGKLNEAMDMYSAGLDQFYKSEIRGALEDIQNLINDLEERYKALKSIFRNIKDREDLESYQVLLSEKKDREDFYEKLSKFSRLLNDANTSLSIRNKLGKKCLDKYRSDFKFYQELRKIVMIRYSDDVDHKEYQQEMQKMIDDFIVAEDLNILNGPVNILDDEAFKKEINSLPSKKAIADTIRTRISKSINLNMEKDPLWYHEIGERLNECYQEYKKNVEKNIKDVEEKYYRNMNKIYEDYKNGPDMNKNYPKEIFNNRDMQIYYDISKKHFTDDFLVSEGNENKGVYNKNKFLETSRIVNNTISDVDNRFWYTNETSINQVKIYLITKLFEYYKNSNGDIVKRIDDFVSELLNIKIERLRNS